MEQDQILTISQMTDTKSETKKKLIDKILEYMKKKGEILDKIMDDKIESFYISEDEIALEKMLKRMSKNNLLHMIHIIKSIQSDAVICPFCYRYYNPSAKCRYCPYKKYHGWCESHDIDIPTYRKVIYHIIKQDIHQLTHLQEIKDLINSIFEGI